MCIYRAKEGEENDSFKEARSSNTRRPPGNVPYVVDNLWEWTRPEKFPDRRKSKFASPAPEQALRSAVLPEDTYEHVFRIEFVGDPIIAQLPGVEDAKQHPDCTRSSPNSDIYKHTRKDPDSPHLRRVLFKKLGGKFTWSSKERRDKRPASELFQPCLTAEEVETILDESDEIKPSDKDDLRDSVSYWDDLELIGPENLANEQKGEILFEFRYPDDGDGYWRRSAEDGC